MATVRLHSIVGRCNHLLFEINPRAPAIRHIGREIGRTDKETVVAKKAASPKHLDVRWPVTPLGSMDINARTKFRGKPKQMVREVGADLGKPHAPVARVCGKQICCPSLQLYRANSPPRIALQVVELPYRLTGDIEATSKREQQDY